MNGNIQSSKLNSRLKRIDGTVATIIAYATLTRYKLDYESKSNKVTAASVDKRKVSTVRDDFGLGLIKPLISIWKKLLT